MDAIKLLEEDHEHVRDLLHRMLATTAEQVDLRHQLFELLHQELEIHARIEEDHFYPAIDRKGEHEHQQVEDSREEHQWMRQALSGLEHTDLSDSAWKVGVRRLGDCIEHHLKEEEEDLFPRARDRIRGELDAMGDRMYAEKSDLMRAY